MLSKPDASRVDAQAVRDSGVEDYDEVCIGDLLDRRMAEGPLAHVFPVLFEVDVRRTLRQHRLFVVRVHNELLAGRPGLAAIG